MNIKKWFIHYTKGIFIGFGTLIPGVSGGTTAIILNEFENILNATADFFNNTKKSLKTIFPIFMGISTGLFLLSKPLSLFCNSLPNVSKYIFVAISLFSTFIFIKSSIKAKITWKNVIYILIGSLAALSIVFITTTVKLSSVTASPFILFLIGFPLSLALVLPAISFSYMLLFFGLYDKILNAIYNFDFLILISLGMGTVIGTFLFSKILVKLLDKHKAETYFFVLGFILCSLIDIMI